MTSTATMTIRKVGRGWEVSVFYDGCQEYAHIYTDAEGERGMVHEAFNEFHKKASALHMKDQRQAEGSAE